MYSECSIILSVFQHHKLSHCKQGTVHYNETENGITEGLIYTTFTQECSNSDIISLTEILNTV